MYAYQDLKFTRQQCKPSDANCIFCGKEVETQKHVHECEHAKIAQLKLKMYTDIASTISSEVYDDNLKNWIIASAPVIWVNKSEQLPQNDDSTLDRLSGIDLSSVPSCYLTNLARPTMDPHLRKPEREHVEYCKNQQPYFRSDL